MTISPERVAKLLKGCGTHSCFVRQGPLTGMGTNGRCRCADTLRPGELRALLDTYTAQQNAPVVHVESMEDGNTGIDYVTIDFVGNLWSADWWTGPLYSWGGYKLKSGHARLIREPAQ